MKKITLFFLMLCLSISYVKAQTCTSPIIIDSLNGQFTPIDSFNTQNRFFKFVSNNYHFRFKFYIKNFSPTNHYIKIYNDDCANLSTNELTVTPSVNGDSIEIYSNLFTQSSSYLIEIGRNDGSSNYISYRISINGRNPSTWSCGGSSPCPVTNTCELVCNGSFEEMTDPSNTNGYITNAANWNNGNATGDADLFSAVATSTAYSNPCNFAGYQSPYNSGNCSTNYNYAGILTEDNVAPLYNNYSEYIQTKLTTSLTAGKSYVISFYVSKAENRSASLPALGIYLTSTPASTAGAQPLGYTPTRTVNTAALLNNTTAWTPIRFCYTASGGEQYLTIGRPAGSITTPGSPVTVPACPGNTLANSQYGHYLYIDEVSLKLFDLVAPATQSVNVCGSVTLNPTFACNSVPNTTLTYSWLGTQTLSSTSVLNPVATVNSSTSFMLTAFGMGSDGTQCSASTTAYVTSNTITPLAISASNTIVCAGSPVTLNATQGAQTYTWQPSNQSNPATYNPTITSTYTLTGTTSNNCLTSNTITINAYADVSTISANPSAICTGQSSTLTASGSVNGYTWQPGSLTGGSVVVNPTSTTVYTVTGLSSNSCVITKTTQVTVNPLPIISVSPSNSNTICLNSSIAMSASGGSSGSYTWNPGNIVATSWAFSPTVATSYTVSSTSSFGCIGATTFTVYVNPLPNVTCNPGTTKCPNITTNPSASGASTYTWNPGNLTGSSISVSPSVTTSYTVIGTSVLGCTNSCMVTQSVYPANIFSVTATPSVVCGSTGGGTSTLTTPGGSSTYTWSPGGTVSPTMAVTSTSVSSPIYTVTSTSSLGCLGSNTVHVLISDGFALVATPPTICTTTTLNLANGVLATPWPGGTFSVNGVASAPTISLAPGNYTIAYTNTTSLMCNPTGTAAITVYSVPATPTITGTSTFVCGGSNATLTANPGTNSYSWNPGGYVGNPYVVTPTTTIFYNVMAINGDCNSLVSGDFIVTGTPISCNCYQNCNTSLSGTITSDPTSGQVYCVQSDLFISGNRTITNCDLKISPNVTITVLPSSTLNILGSHLYACDNMWAGIVVQQGGKINIVSSGSLSPFIEDAFVAVDILPTASYTATNILNATDVNFNKNQVGIRIGDYSTNQTTYPFTIQNCLFTSRTISFTTLTYSTTTTIKNSASGNTSTLQTPYISNSSYPGTTLKAPLTGLTPSTGIVLFNVGYTAPFTNLPYNIVIGNSTVSTNFNCFDNLREDVTANNSNVIITNNVFQNGARYGRGSTSGGKAIVATSITGSTQATAANNNIQLKAASTNTALNNRFYEKIACADITGYYNTEVSYAQVYCYMNAYGYYNTLGVYGDRGFNIKTNRYVTMMAQNNTINNIKNAIMFAIDDGQYYMPTGTGTLSGSGRIIGNIIAQNNVINGHPTSTTSTEYCNIGISVQDLFATSSSTAIGAAGTQILSNKLTNIHNGISVSNVSYASVLTNSNAITIVNEPNSFITPAQNGILSTQVNISSINQNSVTGPATYTNEISAIKTSMNNTLTVKCNTTSSTVHGLNFNGAQALTTVQDNIMQSQKYGISLTNTATIGQQGNSTTPTNNQWLGTWSGVNKKTMNYNQQSSAQSSKMYVDYTNTVSLDPNTSSTVITTPGAMLQDDYFHQSGNSGNTLLNVTTTVSPGCRLSGGGGGGGGGRLMSPGDSDLSPQLTLMATLVSDTSLSSNIAPANAYIGRNMVYRQLKGIIDPSANAQLNTFYGTAQNACFEKFYSIEDGLQNGDYGSAQSLLSSITPTNSVETNYHNFYNLYLNAKNANFNSSDSAVLVALCNKCPFTDGGVVYQARAFYNIMYNVYISFPDNCSTESSERLFETVVKESMDIKVDFKSKLYPNPSTGEFSISVIGLKENKVVEITITDLLGKVVYADMKMTSGNNVSFKPILLNGTYLVKAKLPDGAIDIHKLIIEK